MLVKKKVIYTLCFALFGMGFGFAQSAQISINQNEKIPQLLSLKMKMNSHNAFGERYKIQIFYGTISQAKSVVGEFKGSHPGWPITIEYQAPNYKVWVGDYRNRLEADRAFAKIKNTYESAFIFRPKG